MKIHNNSWLFHYSPCCVWSWGFSVAFWLGYSNSAFNPVSIVILMLKYYWNLISGHIHCFQQRFQESVQENPFQISLSLIDLVSNLTFIRLWLTKSQVIQMCREKFHWMLFLCTVKFGDVFRVKLWIWYLHWPVYEDWK